MVTAKAEVEEFEEKETFSFSRITRRFKFGKEKPVKEKIFSFSRFFKRRKKEPEIVFASGLGELSQ